MLLLTNLYCVLAIVTLFFLPRHTIFSFIHCDQLGWGCGRKTLPPSTLNPNSIQVGEGVGGSPSSPRLLGRFLMIGSVDQLKMVDQCCDNEDERTEVNQKEPVLHACEYCWSCILSSRG